MSLLYAIVVFMSAVIGLINMIRLFSNVGNNSVNTYLIVVSLVSLGISIVFGMLSLQYNSRMKQALQNGVDQDYNEAFKTLRAYFVFYGIVMILVFLLLIIVAIYVYILISSFRGGRF